MNYIILYVLLITVLLGDSIITIEQKAYTINDFYQEYGKKEWDNAKANQKCSK